MTPTLSLVHATYRSGRQAVQVRDAWVSSAIDADRVEHIFAMDDDDEATIAATQNLRRVINPASEHVTAVRNWNAAAAEASGSILVVIADDLFPPPGWDQAILDVTASFDARRVPYAVKLNDKPDDDRPTLLRHPVVSRAFYDRFGLFDPRFTGHCCDDDITIRAFRQALVIDGRSIVVDHVHPLVRDDAEASESHRRMNTAANYAVAKLTLFAVWGPVERRVDQSFFPPRRTVRAWTVRLWTVRRRCRGFAETVPREVLTRVRRRLAPSAS